MFDVTTPSPQILNLDRYRDKVLGCWTGKNIGGTLGAPFEGRREMNAATFYVQDLRGAPAPNDDLDLQLVWLQAAEENGLYRLTPRLLGEYWMNFIVGPWNEYGVCKANIASGLYPPLSGSCNNEIWKFSNGAWIRSEIWACLFPGSPDEAAVFAGMDACCDHCGEGIYAEVFTAALQSAAFMISDIRRLIAIGLAKIPPECRVARSVRLACHQFDHGAEFASARAAIVKDSEDLGWFQAPGNLGFAILGLLYGRGDFGNSICLATNCGDDTDCTAATVGALLGIISGRSGIPQKWIEPIGESIKTVVINPFGLDVPRTLGDLTARVVGLALAAQRDNPTLPRLCAEPTAVTADYLEQITGHDAVAKRVWGQSPYALVFDLPYGQLAIDYEDGPGITAGVEKRLAVELMGMRFAEGVVQVAFKLPDGWHALPGATASLNCIEGTAARWELAIIPGVLADAFTYIPVELRLAGRFNPVTIQLPFQTAGSVNHNPYQHRGGFLDHADRKNRRLARGMAANEGSAAP